MDVAELRRETPGCASRIHFNNAGAALMSRRTVAAVVGHLELEARIGGYEAADDRAQDIVDVYVALAELVGGRPEQIAYFDNSTHAWNAAFYSVPLEEGDRILTACDEYGSNVLAYFQVAGRTGAEVVVVPNDEHGQVDLVALEELLDERVKLVGHTWIPTAGGLVNPAAEVGRLVSEHSDALYLLDATQAVGQLPVDVGRLGCDLLTGTGRKFLRGPRGTGFLWTGPRALERLEPFVAEIRSAVWDGAGSVTWQPGAQRFETWENGYATMLGLGSAVREALTLGLEEIWETTRALGSRLRDGLEAIPGVTTHDLGTDRCAIVTASIEGTPAEGVASELANDGINVSTTVPEHNQFDTLARGVHPLVRLSPHYYNTDEEIATVLDSVRRIAQRTR